MQQAETDKIIGKLPPEQLSQLLAQLLQQQRPAYQINRITISELCNKHRQNGVSRELAHSTMLNYENAHNYFLEYAKERGLIYADEVRYDHAEEFYNFLKQRIKRSSVIGRYKAVKAMFAIAERRDYIMKNPFVNKAFQLSPVREWYTDEYVEQLIHAIRTYAKPSNRFKTELTLRITYTTGIRVGILLRIRRKDITINEKGEVFITTDLKIAKSAEILTVTIELLDETTKEMLLRYIAELDKEGLQSDSPIFSKRDNRTAYSNYRGTIARVCEKAGIQYLTPHKAKHGFITKMAKAGLSAEQICTLTGNKTPSLIQKVYVHLFHADVKDRAKEILNK